jgi:Ca2+-binding RTX toxin-like protein
MSVDPTFNGQADEFTSVTKRLTTPDNPFPHNSDDLLYGGLGNDWLHGGSGDDAMSGAEALPESYTQVTDPTTGVLTGKARSDYAHPFNPIDALRFNPIDVGGWHFDKTRRSGEFALYDEYDPLRKVQLDASGNLWKSAAQGQAYEFFLNFNAGEGVFVPSGSIPKNTGNGVDNYPSANNDGNDRIFGDTGNDWLVGGTGRDDSYGGFGNDLLNADDLQTTNGGLNDQPDTQPSYEDRAFGGAGRDVLIANTGGDRLIDWVGEFNSYLVPFAPFGMATVSRTLQPQLAEFLYALSASDGADPTRAADTGKEAARNGEPEGELGVIRQKDVAWQAQTGAPTDPQAGNIPGGFRDVLRSANFNDGSFQALAPDSGTWAVASGTLQVAATSLHGDAVSVFQVGDALPVYYEVQATVKAIKPTSGWNANSYVIFDYQSQTNFKFAGIDVSSNKLVMGHRDASGWIVDKQAAYPSSLKADTYYNLLLTVNGLVATLYVNGTSAFAFTYAATLVDGYSYGLNWGLVGFGSNNSRGAMDDLAVQVVPPAATVVKSETFSGPTNTLFAGTAADLSGGTFTLAAGRYAATPSGSDAAMSLANLSGVTNLAPLSILDLSAKLNTSGRGGFIFDQYSATDFKWAAIDVVTKQVLIGHRQGNNWVIDAAASKSTLVAGTDYTLGVTLRGSTVSVTLDGQVMASFAYNGVTIDGRFGVFAKGGAVSLDSATIRTNDAKVPATLNLASAVPTNADAATPATPTDAQVQALVDEAIRRWAMLEDAALVTRLAGIDVSFGDLEGGELGEYHDGHITLDRNAGGFGWFVDPTPRSDAEFRHTGAVLTALDAAAAGHVDMLSVLMHEMGHAIGFAHSDSGVMSEQLLPGTRTALSIAMQPATLSGFDAAQGSATRETVVPQTRLVQIDWNAARTAPAVESAARLARDEEWQQRFVNHLGVVSSRLNPNAALRVHLPIAPRVTAL